MKNLFFYLFAIILTITACTDECENLACLNGGQCQTGTCICPEGFTGANCENTSGTDPCANVNCINGGICNNGICDCPSGFTGALCQTEITNDPCATVNCLNGGTCNNGVCDCPSGFTGTFCQDSYSQATITSIRLLTFSADNNDEDLYFSISNGTDCDNNGYYTGTIQNVVFSQTYTYNTDYLVNLNQNVAICLWSSPDFGFDFGAGGYNFNTSSLTINYPSSYVLQNSSSPLSF